MRKSTYVKTSRKVIVEKTSKEELFKLTRGFIHSKKCKDGKRRSFYLFFLNDVLILKQKRPFDEMGERGYDSKVSVRNVYLLDGKIHQERTADNDIAPRLVKYPVSKTKLQALNVPPDLKIELTK